MGRYLKEARHHFEKIQYYHRHAGSLGYKQAQYNYSQLGELQVRAERSKNDKRDAVVIGELRRSVIDLIEEMRKRAGVEE